MAHIGRKGSGRLIQPLKVGYKWLNVVTSEFRYGIFTTVKHVLSKHQRDIQNLLAEDMCLLNAGIFQCSCLF